jgi:hypothetical protein
MLHLTGKPTQVITQGNDGDPTVEPDRRIGRGGSCRVRRQATAPINQIWRRPSGIGNFAVMPRIAVEAVSSSWRR